MGRSGRASPILTARHVPGLRPGPRLHLFWFLAAGTPGLPERKRVGCSARGVRVRTESGFCSLWISVQAESGFGFLAMKKKYFHHSGAILTSIILAFQLVSVIAAFLYDDTWMLDPRAGSIYLLPVGPLALLIDGIRIGGVLVVFNLVSLFYSILFYTSLSCSLLFQRISFCYPLVIWFVGALFYILGWGS